MTSQKVENIKERTSVHTVNLPKKKGTYVKVLIPDWYIVTDIDEFQVTQKHYTKIQSPDQKTLYNDNAN